VLSVIKTQPNPTSKIINTNPSQNDKNNQKDFQDSTEFILMETIVLALFGILLMRLSNISDQKQ
jgi:hypothetical protein